jgi:hypothetical protein
MKEIKPPKRYRDPNFESVFLAGSIEMGTAVNWQRKVVSELSSKEVVIYNPRRDDWDSSWKQELNNPQFYEQVTWELDYLDICDYIFMYFDPNTKSPISLLELGLHACGGSKTIIVCCPQGFWRKGNVDIVCQRYSIPVFENLDTAIIELKNRID